jgi:A/G-specific adenine glycosylase
VNVALERWYRPRRAAYPWRTTADPYRILVSELMLQQTQASRVMPAYESFFERFPTLPSLAAAPRAEVVRAWAGLGYNRRAVSLSEAARVIVREHEGAVPSDPELLKRLPGVGPYTAAAIASIAFGVPVAAIDVNIRRVIARLRLGRDDADDGDVRAAANRWLDRDHPGSWNQALMDVGREHCRPVPRCDGCPLAPSCRFRRSGRPPLSPRRAQGRFEGSTRQLRGAVVRRLRADPASVGALVKATASSRERVAAAVRSLVRDGLVRAGPAALAGDSRGRASLR